MEKYELIEQIGEGYTLYSYYISGIGHSALC